MSSEAPRASEPATAGSLLIGGRFRIEALLGQGGMGAVYRAHDERDQRSVALKQLRVAPGSHKKLLFAQFEREYHTLVQLAHPRIIEVYDYGVEHGYAFYTMELLDGQDLRERGRRPWREACAVLCDVASSLAILHSRRLVHRDVSPRNVRCTRDGRAKLFDFGAMVPMGVVKHVVGTPPFVPPEALQLQGLDSRADLYALGALAYFMLTGRYAYPARTFEQLRDIWRSAPSSPRQHDPSLPEALDRLVMQLMQLDREGRPASAAEVMERLSGVAGLTLEELPEVSRAYLAMPTLVGREAPVQEVRRGLVQSMQGQGQSLLIEGDEGVGRSRFLDAAVLQAKLLGALVLRGDASEGATEYGLVKALGRQLLRESQQLGARAARPWRSLLLHVFPELERQSVPEREAAERRHVQSALRNWFLLVAREQHLVIAVDDVHAVDEPSAALLGSLAYSGQQSKLSLILTSKRGAPATAALELLQSIARRLTLDPLTAAQTLSLMRSVFGDVAHVNVLAERIHQLARGHPRSTMALCERLVERRTARYEAGSWLLPAELSADDLPASLTALLHSRVAALSADARELGEALSLTEPTALPPSSYAMLASHSDRARLNRALDELVSAGVLVPEAAHYRFDQHELRDLLQAGLDESRRRELHARLATAIADGDNVPLLARHLLFGGRAAEGIECLLSLQDEKHLVFSSFVLELLESAVQRAEALGIARELRQELMMWLVGHTAVLGDYACFNRYAWSLLDCCVRDSGLSDYHELQAAGLLPEPRLALALERAEQRHRALPAAERGFAPAIACERLSRLCGITVAMGAVAMDIEMMERLPSLAPLVPVFPIARLVQLHVEAARAMQSTRFPRASIAILEILKTLETPDPERSDSYTAQLRLGCILMEGFLTAGIGHPDTHQILQELEREPGHRALAWRLYMVYELMRGNAEAAAECQRRAELLNLQDGGQVIFPGTTALVEMVVHAHAGDVLGVKRVLERATELANTYPGWRPLAAIARAHYHRLQGDFESGLSALEPVLRSAAPSRGQPWGLAAYCHVMLLLAARGPGEALEQGQRDLAICEREDLPATHLELRRVMSEVLAKAGRIEEARHMIEGHIAEYKAYGATGLLMGLAYEIRARIAIALHDEAGVHQYAELCAREYKGGRNLTLSAKYQTLIREAAVSGVSLATALQHAGDVDSRVASQSMTSHSRNSRLLSCIGTEEREHESMRMLLELTGASGGFLFRVCGGKLDPAPYMGTVPPPPGLRERVGSYLEQTLQAEEDVTGGDEGDAAQPTPLASFTDGEGRRYEPLMLYRNRNGADVPTALAVLHYERELRPVLARDVLEMLADALAEDEQSVAMD